MKEKHVDAEKICRHLKYTKHWLDKANEEYQEQRFTDGMSVLNIARAELTAAWEEALQLKTQVFRTVPRKARDNWKPLASAGLLASGFIIALIVTKLAVTPVPGMRSEASDTKAAPRAAAPIVVIQQSAPVESEPAFQAPEVEETAPAANTVTEFTAPARSHRTAASKSTARSEISKPAPQPAVVKASAPAPAAVRDVPSVQTPSELPYTAVGRTSGTPAPQPVPVAARSKELNQSDVIELYNTAHKAINK